MEERERGVLLGIQYLHAEMCCSLEPGWAIHKFLEGRSCPSDDSMEKEDVALRLLEVRWNPEERLKVWGDRASACGLRARVSMQSPFGELVEWACEHALAASCMKLW